MKVFAVSALLLVAGCTASDRASDKEPVWECVDVRDGHRFQFSPSQTTDEVLNLTGENYGYYTEPNGMRHRISRSWAETNCEVVRWKTGGANV